MRYRENDSGLQLLEIEVTNRCNLNCRHCYVRTDRRVDLPQETVRSIIEQSNRLGVNRVVFTGGEPILYRGLFELAEYVKSIGIPEVALLTNGLLINQSNIERLRAFDIIQLSIDTPPKKQNVMRIDYSNTLEKKIDLLKTNHLNVVLFATLSKKILPLIEDLIDFAREKKVKISFNRLSPIVPGLRQECLTPLELRDALKRISDSHIDAGLGCSDPLLFLVDEKKMKYYKTLDKEGLKGGCSAGIATLYINCFGEVYPCPFLQLAVGDIYTQRLADIWENSNYLNALRDRSGISGECGICEYRNFCGGCRAAGFIKHGNTHESDTNCFKRLVEVEGCK